MIAAGLALFASLHYVRSLGYLRPVFDDSYISLQFARNLAEHGKLSFDGQTWSTGATSLLHVGILAALIRSGINPFSASIGLSVLCHVLLALAVYWLALVIFRSRVAAMAAAVLIAFSNYAAYDSGNGMETSLFLALIAAAMAAVLSLDGRRGRLIAGCLIALALLTRPEGLFLLPAAAVYLALQREDEIWSRDFLVEIAILTAPVVAVLVLETLFALAVTGSLTPGTATVKLRFFHEYDLPLTTKFNRAGDFIGIFLGPLAATLVFAAIAARRREAVLFALFLGPMYALYVLLFPGGLDHYFYRYQHPVLPLIAVLAGGGGAILVEEARARGIVTKALVALALVFLAVPTLKYYQHWHILYRDSAFESIVNQEGMARDLNKIIAPDQTLATHDIGAVGYFASYHVLDLVGLVNPAVVKYHSGGRLQEYIQLVRPDYLLILPDWDYNYLHLDPGAHPDQYELVKVYDGGPIRLNQPYVLYRVHYGVSGSR